MTFHNLVLSGGHFKGICYTGVFKALEELKLVSQIKQVLGVSIGSVFALAFAVGLTSEQLTKIIMSISLADITIFNMDNLFSISDTFGLDTGEQFTRIIKIVVKKTLGSENATFKDLADFNPNLNLIIMGTNLTKQRSEYFSYEHTPLMPLHIAIRISIGVPIYFNAIKYNDCYYIDGSFSSNFPIDYFKDDIDNTLGLILTDAGNEKIINFSSYLRNVTNCVVSILEKHFKTIYSNNIVELVIYYDILAMQFDTNTKELLINTGYEQFMTKYKGSSHSTDSGSLENSSNQTIDIVSQNNENIDEMIHSLQDELNSND